MTIVEENGDITCQQIITSVPSARFLPTQRRTPLPPLSQSPVQSTGDVQSTEYTWAAYSAYLKKANNIYCVVLQKLPQPIDTFLTVTPSLLNQLCRKPTYQSSHWQHRKHLICLVKSAKIYNARGTMLNENNEFDTLQQNRTWWLWTPGHLIGWEPLTQWGSKMSPW